MEHESTIRKVLKHELSWVTMIVGGVYGFIVMIALPIQKLQLDMQNVQITLIEIKTNLHYGLTKDNELNDRLTRVETTMQLK